MKIVFLSDIFNHHQKPFSEAIYRIVGKDYVFIETKVLSKERKNMGWGMEQYPSYVISKECLDAYFDKYMDLINTVDLVITGSAPELLLHERKKAGKLIFRYSERPLKLGDAWHKYPVRLLQWHRFSPMWKPIYMLCASAYTSNDYWKHGLFFNKMYQWGYFPETRRYDDIEALVSKKKRNSILWCGRFIDWKHPDDAIEVAKCLRDDGYEFEMNFIGIGNIEYKMKQLIQEYKLSDIVHLLGPTTPEQVRESMEKASIYLFTSDRQEGWGAVLNESMNSACAVVASHAIGSVPYLINDGQNGLVYESGNVRMLYDKVKYLLNHQEEQRRLGIGAYRTISEEWNGEVAAERVIYLAKNILNGVKTPDLYISGPCSKAKKIRERWMNK